MDIGSTSHLTNDFGNLYYLSSLSSPYSNLVGNGSNIPTLGQDSTTVYFPKHSHSLKTFITHQRLSKNLISIHKFTRCNLVSIKLTPSVFYERSYHAKTPNEMQYFP